MNKLYEKLIEMSRQAMDIYNPNKLVKDYPLYIHGTSFSNLCKILEDKKIKPSGEVPANYFPIIRGYVSIQKGLFAFESGHGAFTLIIDGEKLDQDKIEYHEEYRHEIYKGHIPISTVLAIQDSNLDVEKIVSKETFKSLRFKSFL